MTASELDVYGCDSVVSVEAGNSSGVEVVVSSDDAVPVGGWFSVVGDTLMWVHGVTEERLMMWLDQEWFNLVGWTGSSAQTVTCYPIHHRCTHCVCVVCYWLLPVNRDMEVASDSIHSVVYR